MPDKASLRHCNLLCSSMMLRDGQLLEAESLSELGVYGTFIRQGDDVLLNKQAGHLVRTKVSPHCSFQLFCSLQYMCLFQPAIPRLACIVTLQAATSNEGGVAAGFAVLDSPYLVSA